MITCPTCDGDGGPGPACPDTGYPLTACPECRGRGLVPSPLDASAVRASSCDADLHRAVELSGNAFTYDEARLYRDDLRHQEEEADARQEVVERIGRIAYQRTGVKPW